MDNERYTIDKSRFKIAIIGGSSSAALGTMVHLAMEAKVVVLSCEDTEIRGLKHDLIYLDEIRPRAIRKPLIRIKERKRCRGGGHFDARGRRR